MSRHGPPDHTAPDALAGLTKRQQRRADEERQGEPSIQCTGGYHFLCRDQRCSCWCHGKQAPER